MATGFRISRTSHPGEVILAVLLFVPFIAWYVFRAGYATRSGVFSQSAGRWIARPGPQAFGFGSCIRCS